MLDFIKIYFLAVCLFFSVAIPTAAGAVDNRSLEEQIAGKAGYATQGVNEFTLSETIGRVIKVALGFVGTLFFALTVYAGYLLMTAQGNEDQVTKAKDILKMAVIGMIIVVAAYSITTYVLIFMAQSTSFSSSVGK